MAKKKILVVEDEAPIRVMLRQVLTLAKFKVLEADSGKAAVLQLSEKKPDLILLDWMLPDTSGIELARRFRKEEYSADIPIIMLTARVEEEDRILGFEVGADDYVTKPFSPRELVARIKAVLRRSSPNKDNAVIEVGKIILDTDKHAVTIKNEIVDLGPTEYKLLTFFMLHPERVYSRSQIIDNVWSHGSFLDERTVDVHIRRLRKALNPYKCDIYIKTVRSSGYIFSPI